MFPFCRFYHPVSQPVVSICTPTSGVVIWLGPSSAQRQLAFPRWLINLVLFVFLLVFWKSFLVKNLFESFAHFSIGFSLFLIGFFIGRNKGYEWILSGTWITNICSYSMACLFILLIIVLTNKSSSFQWKPTGQFFFRVGHFCIQCIKSLPFLRI